MRNQERIPLEEVTAVISTKLDVLIDDFQRFRCIEEEHFKLLDKYIISTNVEMNTLKTTSRWHNIIGAFIISIAITFNTYLYLYVKEVEEGIEILQSTGVYYYKNREVTIEMIEAYKRGYLSESSDRRKRIHIQ